MWMGATDADEIREAIIEVPNDLGAATVLMAI